MFVRSLPIFAGLAGLAIAAAPDLTGQGYLRVYNGTSGTDSSQTEADIVGCLNAKGNFVLDDCAVFSNITSLPQTSVGQCNFLDTTQPLNEDSHYGKSDHAWQCYADADSTGYPLYSIVSWLAAS